jgi:hypothetical protein
MRRNKSLPPEQMEKLPDIAKKQDNLMQLASKLIDTSS